MSLLRKVRLLRKNPTRAFHKNYFENGRSNADFPIRVGSTCVYRENMPVLAEERHVFLVGQSEPGYGLSKTTATD